MLKLLSRMSMLLGWLVLAEAAVAQIPLQLPATSPTDTARGRALAPPLTREEKRAKATADSAKRTERLFGLHLTRPGKAALLAAVAPGAGQIYNRRWWKLPLVYGALGGVIGLEVHYQSRFSEYGRAVDLVSTGRRQLGDPDLGTRASKEVSLAGLQSGVTFYRGYRDIFYLYIALAYSLQVVDALVDAHLREFDVSDDLSLRWTPALLAVPGQSALPTVPGVSFALRAK